MAAKWATEEYQPDINYKFNEANLIKEFKDYIDSTYSSHYSQNGFQSTEIIIERGHGTGFCMGNIMKYAQRYGKKEGNNPADLLKIIHYAIMLYGKEHTTVIDGEEYGW